MIRFQPFGQVMSIADTGASAGTTKSWVASCISSRSGMEPGCGKKLHVSKFGARRFIPGCSNEIPGRFRQCILRFHGWRDTSHTTTRRNDGLHPTTRASERANAGAPRVGPTNTWSEFRSRQTRFSISSALEFRSVAIACHLSYGQFYYCLEPRRSCDAIQNIAVDTDPRPSAVAGQDQTTQMVGSLYL